MIRGNNEAASDSKRRKPANPGLHHFPGLQSVALSQGSEIEIVNISREGMTLETATRLRPDFKVALKVVTGKGAMRIHGVVLRTAICSLAGGPRYRSEVAFNQPLELMKEVISPEPLNDPIDEALPETEAEIETTKSAAILKVLQAATRASA